MSEQKEIYIEEKPSKWTFSNYFKSIKHFKWWIVGATVVGTILGFCSFKFILNPVKQKLGAKFIYSSMPAETDGLGTYKFVDGTIFNINDLTSHESLKAVKDSKEDYANVDVDKIYKNSSLTITSETVTDKSEADTPTILYTSFTIEGTVSSFPNAEIAKSFVYDLINYPKTISEKAIENFEVASYLSAEEFNDAEFDQQLIQLSKQYKAIKETYTQLQTDFSPSTIADGKHLSDYINEFSLRTSAGQISKVDSLSGELHSKGLVKYFDASVASAEAKIDEIDALCGHYAKVLDEKKHDWDRVDTSIKALTSATTTNTLYNEYLEQIVKLTEELSQIQEDIDSIESQLSYYGWALVGDVYKPQDLGVRKHLNVIAGGGSDDDWIQENKDFRDSVISLKGFLSEERLSASKVYRACYQNSKVTFLNAGYVTVKGGMSSIIGLALGLVVGFVASSLICCSVYISKEEK